MHGTDAVRLSFATTRAARHTWRIALVLLCSSLGSMAPAGAEEAPPALRSVLSAIRSAAADLKAAQSTAGTTTNPAKGSRKKLTLMRLSSAKARLDVADKALAAMSASGPGVADAKDVSKQARAEHDRLLAIVSGGATPPPAVPPGEAPTPTPAPSDQPTPSRLDYRAEKLLKDARYYLKEIANAIKQASPIAAAYHEGPTKPVHAQVRAALQVAARGESRWPLVVERLKALPKEHPSVAPVVADATRQGNALKHLLVSLRKADRELDKLTNLVNYPNFETDVRRIQDLARRYANWGGLVQQPDRYTAVIREDRAVVQEIQRIAKRYEHLVAQRTAAGEKLTGVLRWAGQQRQEFATRAAQHHKELPAEIEGYLKAAADMGARAVEAKNAAYFGEHGGIAQQLGFAHERVQMLTALDEAGGAKLAAKVAALEKALAEQAKAMEGEIIANNRMPPDRYQGQDSEALVAQAKAGWAVQQEDATVLAARIVSEQWTRETRWVYDGRAAFYKVDRSRLQVQLFVAHTDELAVNRPINLIKDHLAGDKVIAVPLDSFGEELRPQRYIRRQHVK